MRAIGVVPARAVNEILSHALGSISFDALSKKRLHAHLSKA